MAEVKVGNPFDDDVTDDVTVGSLICNTQRERVKGFVERARAIGAQVLTGSEVPRGVERGDYYALTVLCNVDQRSEIMHSEVFGPVMTIQTFSSDEQAVSLGNDVLYGLAAAVFTKDVGWAVRIASELEFGRVWINDHIPLTCETPHGDFKQSDLGKTYRARQLGITRSPGAS